MPMRLEPVDEYLHELGPETTFNESMYFNVYDPAENVGGFVRLGNRANEGYAEMTTCLYLPDGRVAFMYNRPEISDNDAFAAGGMTFEVVEPFEELKVGYEGKVVMLEDPLEMADPRQAFTNNPYEKAKVELTYTRVSDPIGGEPTEHVEREGEEFAKGHYEQLNAATGIIPCHSFDISTEWTETGTYHRALEATLHHAEGSLKVTGKVLNLIPLRNRRDGRITRISEGLTEWTLEDGRVGYGLSEYLDQIIDDQPVGLAE